MDAQNMRPRVLVLTKLFWPEGSGGELATYLITKNILSKHFDVFIVSGTRKPRADVLRLAKYIYWSVLETEYKPIEWLKLFANTHWLRRLIEGADVIYIPSHTLIPMAVVAKHLKPNVKVVLHLHNYQVVTFTSIVLAGRRPDVATDIIVEYEEHGSLARALMAGIGHYINYVNRYALKYVDRAICVSKRQCEIILKYLPELRDRTIVVYNPPPPFLNVDKRISNERVLIYAGGKSYSKGVYTLLKALTRTKIRKYSIFMSKSYIAYTRKVSAKEKWVLEKLNQLLDNRLIFLDRLPYEKFQRLYEIAWGSLVPSINEEPFGYVIVESMLASTIPIAARVGGVPEIVRGTPAEKYLFAPGNVDELVDRIETLFSLSREDIVDAGMKLRKHALKLFNEEEIEDKITGLFNILASRGNAKFCEGD
jgi:glycosyltransferase involved in cell wall biosynthesis